MGMENCWICQEILPKGTDRGCQDIRAEAEAAVWGRTRGCSSLPGLGDDPGEPAACARVPRGSGLGGLPRLGQEESPQHQGHFCPLGWVAAHRGLPWAAAGHLQ